jgi:hypothetical protein
VNIMNKRLLMSVAAAALIAGTSFVNAQGAGGAGREGGAGGAGAGAGAAAHSAPSGGAGGAATAPGGAGDRAAGGAAGGAGDRAAQTERNAPAGKDEATDTTNRSDQRQDQKAQSDDKMQRDNSRNATDSTRDNAKGGKDAKAEGNNADSKNPNAKSAADDKGMNKQTTGQAGAGAKLSSEQRTKVTTVIKQQNIKPVTNVNFSISVGTRVPRDVEFHPLPAEIITVYPDWRGYDFILVNDQILVINPRSYEIVAVIDA